MSSPLGTEAPWFDGDALSAADTVISYVLEAAHVRGYVADAHLYCQARLECAHACPSFQAAKTKDGKPTMILSL